MWKWGGYIKWNTKSFCEHRFFKRSYFIGNIAVGSHAVGSHNHHLDFALLHKVTGGIVGYYIMSDFSLPSSQAVSRAPWLRGRVSSTKTVKFFCLVFSLIQRRQRTSMIHKSKPTGIAVGKNSHSIFDQDLSNFANSLSFIPVFFGK
jgi:hypothetical protein